MNKWLLAALALTVSALQAWDSSALTSEGGVQLLIATAVLLPAATVILSSHAGVRLSAAGAAIALLGIARLVSEAHMPELMLAGAFAGILILASQLFPTARRSAA
jgi:membrane-associated phospholipid phosphatase